MRTVILAVTALTMIVPPRAIGQDALRLTPGAKVRVTVHTLGLNKQVGTVHELGGDTLVIQTKAGAGADMLQVNIPAINRLDIRTGSRNHWLEGAAIGALAGVVTGLAWGNDSKDAFHLDLWYDKPGVKALAGGAVGALVGAGVGALITSDRWSEVPLDQIRPRLVAQQDGVGVGVVLRF